MSRSGSQFEPLVHTVDTKPATPDVKLSPELTQARQVLKGVESVSSRGSDHNVKADQADEYLVEQCQQGNRHAFDLLVTKYQHRIVNLAMRYVKDPSEALDVAQDAFIKAYQGLGNFRGESSFYTWLYRIGMNTAINYVAAKKRRAVEYIDPQNPEETVWQSRLNDEDTPEHWFISEEVKIAVIAALGSLPDELRNALVLREIEGMSYEEIAAAMDCPIGTVRSRIFRAREAIDEKVKELI